MNVVREIQLFNIDREPERLALKYRAMRADNFAFLRGSCHLYYAQLPRSGPLRSAPLAWSCGDLHLNNLGSYKGDNRLAYFDINDFDEAVLAPASWDVVRLLSSVILAAEQCGLSTKEARVLCSLMLETYAATLALGKAYWIERDTAQGVVGALLDGLRQRSRPAFLDSRTRLKGKRRVLRLDNGKALPIDKAQRTAVLDFMADFAAQQPDPRFYEVLDVARRIAGLGSLGTERYSILVRGKGSPDGNYLLDLKAALPSSLSKVLKTLDVRQPRWPTEAHRVVALQRRLQAVSIAFMQPVQMQGRDFVIRALHPSEDRVDFKRAAITADGLQGLVTTTARVTAWAQLRSVAYQGAAGPDELVDFGQRRKWPVKLLDQAEAAAQQVRIDAAEFNQAFDDGALQVPLGGLD